MVCATSVNPPAAVVVDLDLADDQFTGVCVCLCVSVTWRTVVFN